MTAKPKSTDANTREYWELAVRNPAEYGLTEEQVLAMKESLALTDPKYWKRVLKDPNSYGYSAEHAKNLAKKHAKTLAEHIDEQNQMTPEEKIEAEAGHHIGYYDSTHGKGHVQMWLEMSVVSPGDAAQLLHGENPTVFKVYDLGDVFGNMKKSFEDVARDGRDRNLRDWIGVAHDRNLQGRCIDGWETCTKVLAIEQARLEKTYARTLAAEICDTKSEISECERKPDGNVPSEARIKREDLAALRSRLANLEKLYLLPAFMVNDWKTLTNDAVAELVTVNTPQDAEPNDLLKETLERERLLELARLKARDDHEASKQVKSVVTSKARGSVKADRKDTKAESPWLVSDPRDPMPEQPWYTPARYFARQLVKGDSTLLLKRGLLAEKVSQSLAAVGIYKRGGRKSPNSTTVLKAFSNVTLG